MTEGIEGTASEADLDAVLNQAYDAEEKGELDTLDLEEGTDDTTDVEDVEGGTDEEDLTAADLDEKEGEETDSKTEDQEEDHDDTISPPRSWASDKKEMFAQLPRDVQEYVLQRETERDNLTTQKSNELAQKSKQYENFDRVLEPYKEQFALDGIDPAQHVQALFAVEDLLDQDFGRGIMHVMDRYDVTPQQLVHYLTNQQRGVDPRDQRIQALEQRVQQQEATHVDAREEETNRTIVEPFKAQTDEEGKLAHPFFNDLEPTIINLIPVVQQDMPGASPQEILKESYDRAVFANPTTRKKLAAMKAKKEQSRAKRARSAGVSLSGAPGAANGKRNGADPADLDGLLSSEWDRQERATRI